MVLYFPKNHYNQNYRGHVFPLLKPFLKGENYSDVERLDLYGVSEKDFRFVNSLEDAEIAILTMSWNYYIDTGKKELALKFIELCSQHRKKIFIYNAGDKSYKIPFFSNALIFRLSVNTLTIEDNDLVIPPFIPDPLKTFYKSGSIYLRPYSNKPKIGFCGFAKNSKIEATKELMKIEFQNIKSLVGLRTEEPQQFLSSSYFRGGILDILKKSSKVDTNFIVRKNYRAGIMHDITHSTVLEFYNNIRNSDYVLCARGSGNYSVRFYETLAMGRIPVYVNTRGGLPLEDQIKWKDHVVWIEQSEVNCIGRKVWEFHNKRNSKSFQDLLTNNRKLWEENLTLGSYFKNILASEIIEYGIKE